MSALPRSAHALVTGGGRGIGREIAAALARHASSTGGLVTAEDLAAKTPLVALAASRLGKTRLIDNLEIDL